MKLPTDLSGQELRRALERIGFIYQRQKGSHMILRRDDPHPHGRDAPRRTTATGPAALLPRARRGDTLGQRARADVTPLPRRREEILVLRRAPSVREPRTVSIESQRGRSHPLELVGETDEHRNIAIEERLAATPRSSTDRAFAHARLAAPGRACVPTNATGRREIMMPLRRPPVPPAPPGSPSPSRSEGAWCPIRLRQPPV